MATFSSESIVLQNGHIFHSDFIIRLQDGHDLDSSEMQQKGQACHPSSIVLPQDGHFLPIVKEKTTPLFGGGYSGNEIFTIG